MIYTHTHTLYAEQYTKKKRILPARFLVSVKKAFDNNGHMLCYFYLKHRNFGASSRYNILRERKSFRFLSFHFLLSKKLYGKHFRNRPFAQRNQISACVTHIRTI